MFANAAAHHASPYHDDPLIDALGRALADVWTRLGLPIKPSAMERSGMRG